MPNPAAVANLPPQSTAVLRRLPGKARPREVALQEYNELNAKRREGLPPVRQKPPSRAALERRLKAAEAETERLREQLTQLDAESEDQ